MNYYEINMRGAIILYILCLLYCMGEKIYLTMRYGYNNCFYSIVHIPTCQQYNYYPVTDSKSHSMKLPKDRMNALVALIKSYGIEAQIGGERI
jgi:hypothetical protein